LFRYRARNFPESLSEIEKAQWQEWRHERLHNAISGDWLTRETLLTRLDELEKNHQQEPKKLAVLSELRAWELEVC
jgi:exodeoxyribonuclease-1